MKSAVHRIGVFTSGGDAPGMNAAIRAVVRASLHYGIDCIGIRRGYHGLLNGDFARGVAQAVDALQRGVTGGIISNGISRTGDVIVNGAGNADDRDTPVGRRPTALL